MNWSFCVGICMDGTAAMTGWLSGFSPWVKEVTSDYESMYCMIYRLAEKCHLNLNVLQDVIKMINHIKVHTLNSCQFTQFCQEMDAGHTHPLLYTEVRWLSLKVDHWLEFWIMITAPEISFKKQSPLAAHFSDIEWITKLAYLCDIHNLYSELNLSLRRGQQPCTSQQIKWLHSKANWKHRGHKRTLGFGTFQTLPEVLNVTD